MENSTWYITTIIIAVILWFTNRLLTYKDFDKSLFEILFFTFQLWYYTNNKGGRLWQVIRKVHYYIF